MHNHSESWTVAVTYRYWNLRKIKLSVYYLHQNFFSLSSVWLMYEIILRQDKPPPPSILRVKDSISLSAWDPTHVLPSAELCTIFIHRYLYLSSIYYYNYNISLDIFLNF